MQIGRLLSAFSQRYVHPAGGESDMVLTPQPERATRGSRGHAGTCRLCHAGERGMAGTSSHVRSVCLGVRLPASHPALPGVCTKHTCDQPGLSQRLPEEGGAFIGNPSQHDLSGAQRTSPERRAHGRRAVPEGGHARAARNQASHSCQGPAAPQVVDDSQKSRLSFASKHCRLN
jgi:hypothetical protein